jgi:hypothetical protein
MVRPVEGMTAQRHRLQAALWSGPSPTLRMRREADATIRALRAEGRLGPRDKLLVALIRTTADAADDHRADPDAAYHLAAALKLLTELDGRLRELAGPSHDEFDDLLTAAGTPGTAPPRDAA